MYINKKLYQYIIKALKENIDLKYEINQGKFPKIWTERLGAFGLPVKIAQNVPDWPL